MAEQTTTMGLVDRLFADPPQVHIELGNPDGGVWRTDRDCYEFIASCCVPGDRTLETGLGVSTALFLLCGTRHTCVTPFQSEVDRLYGYCRQRDIDVSQLELGLGFSDAVLPALPNDELDLMLLDGGHAFPTPMIDWFYGAGRLRRGGTLVLDDMHLPAVATLVRYLECDPRWSLVHRTPKWSAWRRESEGSLREEWSDQAFYVP